MSNECVNNFIIYILNTLQKTHQSLSLLKPWCIDSDVLSYHHSHYTTGSTQCC